MKAAFKWCATSNSVTKYALRAEVQVLMTSAVWHGLAIRNTVYLIKSYYDVFKTQLAETLHVNVN